MLSIAAEKGWRMRSLDVSHAFMHSPLPGQVRINLKLPQSISTLTGELAYLGPASVPQRAEGREPSLATASIKHHNPSGAMGRRVRTMLLPRPRL